jgi:hypothetical protein
MTAACGMIFWLKIHHCQPLFACQGKTTIIWVAKPGKVFAWNIEFFLLPHMLLANSYVWKTLYKQRRQFLFSSTFSFFFSTYKQSKNKHMGSRAAYPYGATTTMGLKLFSNNFFATFFKQFLTMPFLFHC